MVIGFWLALRACTSCVYVFRVYVYSWFIYMSVWAISVSSASKVRYLLLV